LPGRRPFHSILFESLDNDLLLDGNGSEGLGYYLPFDLKDLLAFLDKRFMRIIGVPLVGKLAKHI
jgi:hypothetical protein